MGHTYRAKCEPCGHVFVVDVGGGRIAEAVRCLKCGESESVLHEDIWDSYLAYEKGSYASYNQVPE